MGERVSGAFWAEGLYLALDTSGALGYVAVSRGGDVLARARLERRGQHASRLVPVVSATLEEAGVDAGELSGVIVGDGPGSFTGVRVAAATAKGLAAALGIPLWAVSSLAAAAISDDGDGGPGVRYALFDARADRLYAACYGVGSVGVETLVPPHATTLLELLAEAPPAGAVFVGDGAERHHRTLQSAGFQVRSAPWGEPTADALVRFLAMHPETPPVTGLDTWEPRYLKASNAEREWIA
jgi:tRNA threonylcarbamoyladenosine biosynthesis protein TsaB